MAGGWGWTGKQTGKRAGVRAEQELQAARAGLPHSTLCLSLPNAPAGLLVAARPSACSTKAWGRPDPRGTRLFRQSCHRPAGQRASQEPGSGGLPEGVEYIPTRKKGKNPMKPVGVAW